MKWHIWLGIASTVAMVVVLGWVALNETSRMARFTAGYAARQVENGATLYENRCRTCHGPQGRGVPGLAPAINAPDLFSGERLAQAGFSGTLENYLRGVIAAGRPVPSAGTSYPERMPSWGQEFGGPLRNDEIDSLVAFVMN
jgi:mono/diheme cytochrome c family protein